MAEPLKYMYNEALIEKLGSGIQHTYQKFDTKAFTKSVFDNEWEDRELKSRMRHITNKLGQFLPSNYSDALKVMEQTADQFSGFEAVLFPDFVEVFGIDHPEISLPALEYFTQFSTSEFAIRPFIIQDSKNTMQQMLKWSKHENHHMRRLASEGCRPRLPWAMALEEFKKDPAPILQLLENLKNDESEYVRKSVANNLNDIAKDHPDITLKTAKSWKGKTKNTDWIVKHACRTLLKQGHRETLMLFDFGDPKCIIVSNLRTKKKTIKIGDDLHFSFDLYSDQKEKSLLRVEYKIYYMKANGKQSPKIFKITENYYGQTTVTFNRKQAFTNFSTRKHYPGQHKVSIVINGKEMVETTFNVIQ
jgi:3-methyladenine DNA glycosylase AlkC